MTEQTLYFAEARKFLTEEVPNESIDLVCTDPPYFGIVDNKWDNQWKTEEGFVGWFLVLCKEWFRVLQPNGTLVFFSSIGKKNPTVALHQIVAAQQAGFTFQNMLVWSKRRAYGKPNDYLFTREEIFWLTKHPSEYTFNVPLLSQKRGYAGFNKDYPAKSEFKRVTNVWMDINELFRPRRVCEKPVGLMERLVLTHSNRGDTVLDSFAGTGVTGVACARRGRNFIGTDLDPLWVKQGQRDIDESEELPEEAPVDGAKVVDDE